MPNGCWPFIGARDGHEYGVISWGGRTRGAHQVALELAGYIIPAKFLRVRHYVCHNPPCCRPSHLRIGTPQEDADDKVAADRQQRGEYAGCAKLDPVKVDEIYRLYEAGDTTEEVLALQFGVTIWAINRILRGKGWKHLGLDPIQVVLGSRAAQGERNGNAKLDPATPFNFVSTADTIGGNSGSPVLNRAGELVGLNFDRNRHGLVRNFVYTEEQARHIAVHSRAVLEALRRLYDAGPLVKELTGRE